MAHRVPTDEELLTSGDPASFEEFYGRHVEAVLGFFARRTRDAELAADLTAETFAAALAGRRRYRPSAGAGGAWLYGIAMKKLADAQRRGFAERRARRRMGMERIELHEDDVLHHRGPRHGDHRDGAVAGAARTTSGRRSAPTCCAACRTATSRRRSTCPRRPCASG